MKIADVAKAIGVVLPDSIDNNIECNRVLTQSIYVKQNDVIISAGWYPHTKTINEALEKGASLVFCDYDTKKKFPQDIVIAIDNPMDAVTRFEKWVTKPCKAKRIAITGSVGKTTTTGLINSVIANTFNTFTHHTMSNSHGAILRNAQQIKPEHEYWVQEVGGVQPGYVESSARFLCPDIVVLTNISDSHLDLYGSKENIFYDKSSLERYASPTGTVVINYDDEILRNAKYSHNVITISKNNKNADYYSEDFRMMIDGIYFTVVSKEGKYKVHLNLYGEHNIYNALCAFAVGRLAGVSAEKIPELLETYHSSGMRQNLVKVGGFNIFVDTFNAEPQTVLGAAETLDALQVEEKTRKIFASGHIDKLGENSEKMHTQLGHDLSKLNLDFVALFNGDAIYTYRAMLEDGCTNVFYTDDRDEFDNWLRNNVTRNDILFCKSGQFKAGLAKSIDHVYGTTFQNEQQYNEGTLVSSDGFNFKLRQDNIAEVVGYDGSDVDVVIPSNYENYEVVRIAPYAFSKKNNIINVIVPDTVTTIGKEAFYDCCKLEKIEYPKKLLYIGDNCFNNCISLQSAYIPEGTLHIGRRAYYGCSSLNRIYIPDSVGFIGDNAFGRNTNIRYLCNKGSYAYEYAKIKNNFNIVELNKMTDKKDIEFIRQNNLVQEKKPIVLKNRSELTVSEKKLLDRANYWKKTYYNRTNNTNILSEEQKKKVLLHWNCYQNLFEVDSIFHSFYYDKTGIFDVNFMPVDIFYCFIDPYFNKWDIAPVIDNKCMYRQLFKDTKQPQTPLLRMNGIWTNEEGELVSGEKMRDVLNAYDEFVVKQANDSEGDHNLFFISGEDKINKFEEACGLIKKDIVVQESIKQHPALKQLCPTSINTVRVLSLLSQDEVKIISVILRMGVNGSRVDNISQGGISCGVDENGRLKEVAYNYRGDRFEQHPTTGVKFDSVVLPNFKKLCRIVKKTHPLIPYFRLVSWDLAIDVEGEPILVEANLCYGELNLHQLSNGPIFGKHTQTILNEVFLSNSL